MRLRCGVFWGVLGGLRERGIESVEMMNVEGNGKPWCYLINVETYMKKTKWIAIKQARGD